MSFERVCPLCGKDNCNVSGSEVITISCVTCGDYRITREAREDLPEERDLHQHLVKVSSYTRYRTIHGLEPITLFLYDASDSTLTPRTTIKQIIDEFPKKISNRLDKALLNIVKLSKFSGDKVKLYEHDYTVFYPDGKDINAAFFIFKQLDDEGFIRGTVGFPTEVTVLAKGWNRVYELEKGTNPESNQAFIAMWFDTEMDKVAESGFKRAIREAGFEPIRVDDREHNDKIDDRIISEIRRSRFVVCDFTGHRGGVYFEAGFAMGLGIPVIWSCKADDFDDLHFDTRQYNHIRWIDEEDLYHQLYNRIRATIV
jgi:hypothetical protein